MRIGRRMFVTHCTGFGFDAENNKFLINEDIPRRVNSIARATLIIQKQYDNPRIIIEGITITSKYYSMPVDVFIKNCDQVTESKED